MKTITMLDLRQRAAEIIQEVARGRAMVLTYRGKPTVRLEPIRPPKKRRRVDPFYTLGEIAADGGESMTNEEMDKAIYGA
jgi:prevent-host-death family protein